MVLPKTTHSRGFKQYQSGESNEVRNRLKEYGEEIYRNEDEEIYRNEDEEIYRNEGEEMYASSFLYDIGAAMKTTELKTFSALVCT